MEAIQKQKEEMAMMTSAFEQQKNEMQRFMEETQRKQVLVVIEIHGSKISFYHNIFLSQYCVSCE